MGSLEYGYVKNAYVEIDKREDRIHFEERWVRYVFCTSVVSLIICNISIRSHQSTMVPSILALAMNCACCLLMMKENRKENTDKILSVMTVIGTLFILVSVALMV